MLRTICLYDSGGEPLFWGFSLLAPRPAPPVPAVHGVDRDLLPGNDNAAPRASGVRFVSARLES
jgi:hypothetical protein